MKRPTQTDVARIAGVSRATVSLIINNQAGGRVPISEDTRLRVQAAISELGYVPDASARALRSGGTNTIGFLLPDTGNPHFWDNIEGMEQGASELGYKLLLSNLPSRDEYGEKMLRDVLSQRIDGLIIQSRFLDLSPLANRLLQYALRRHLPMVEISGSPKVDHSIDCVVSDYQQATREIVAHLVGLGHRRMGLIYGVSARQLALDRMEGYDEAHRAAGLTIDPDLVVECGPAVEDGYQAAVRLLQLPEPPTAILAINDLLAIGVVRAAADLGVKIPEQLSLAGFDDIFAARYLVPRLTTVSKDAISMGRAAAQLLIERIQAPNAPRRVLTFPARVLYRESTGPAWSGAGTSPVSERTQGDENRTNP